MTTLKIMRGVPGSGKTWRSMQLAGRGWTSVSRDDIRMALFGKYYGVNEEVVTDVENAAIESALRAGQNTVVDATNLNNKALKTKLSLASRYGATVEFVDCPVDLVTACLRDREREAKTVGDSVIVGFFKRYKIDIESGVLPPAPEPLPVFERYVGNPNLPPAYMVDTDGTVADSDGVRSPYDTSKYHLDKPREHVIEVVDSVYTSGNHAIIALSARDETYRSETQTWWREHGVPYHEFIMRPAGDKRMDAIVKYELFMQHVAPNYNVLGVFDDRPQVLRMWQTIGVPTIDVGHGREF